MYKIFNECGRPLDPTEVRFAYIVIINSYSDYLSFAEECSSAGVSYAGVEVYHLDNDKHIFYWDKNTERFYELPSYMLEKDFAIPREDLGI